MRNSQRRLWLFPTIGGAVAAAAPNGIYIDGLDHAGLAYVNVTGLTVQNANWEGILVTNTQYVLIANNHVVSNNQSLVHTTA